jgi:hypothetical protein
LIVPIRWASKDEIEALNKKIREMSNADMINMFIEKGWSLESARILTKAMKEGVENK